MKTHIPCLSAVLLLATITAHAQIVHYTFDAIYEISNTKWTPNTGTGGETVLDTNTLDLQMRGLQGKHENLVAATGVAGKGHALDFRQNIPGEKNGATARQTNGTLGQLTALTVTGWINVKSPLANKTFLMRNFNAGKNAVPGGFAITATGKNGISMWLINEQIYASASIFHEKLTALNTWIFFAVAWDSHDGMVRWYLGEEQSDAVIILTPMRALNSTNMVIPAANQLCFGRQNSMDPAFCGLLDDIQIFDKALGLDEIKKIRASAL
jgi:hypothetical protein